MKTLIFSIVGSTSSIFSDFDLDTIDSLWFLVCGSDANTLLSFSRPCRMEKSSREWRIAILASSMAVDKHDMFYIFGCCFGYLRDCTSSQLDHGSIIPPERLRKQPT